MTVGRGYRDRLLDPSEVQSILREGLTAAPLDGRRVLIIIPDSTRTAPIPLFFQLFHEMLRPRVAVLDFIVALGTHPALSEDALLRRVGITADERAGLYGRTAIFNHAWDAPEQLVTLDTIPASEMEQLTDGLVRRDLPVAINRVILDYDYLIICAPTYPHEVVGFSGGNKYFFPGISGPEIIHVTHWLGAILTSYAIIGTPHTAVRAVIDRAAQCIPRPRLCASLVVEGSGLAGLYVGAPEEAWEKAAALSNHIHINWVDRPYRQALAVIPRMYDDLWTGAKGMYKLEPVIEAGGEVILFAPHIEKLSITHGAILERIGYHGSEYFLGQWDQFKHYPGAVLAHSAHVRGVSEYSHGVETPRIRVTLASRVPRARCEHLGLGYRDPECINLEDWRGREAEGILFAPKAGERLFRLKR